MDSVYHSVGERFLARVRIARDGAIREKIPLEKDGLSERYERYREILKDLTIMQDIFMRSVFQKRACVEYVLRVLFDRPDLKVEEHVVQMDYKNLSGRSAFLDCVARDAENRRYNVEIQQRTEGASPKRARYHSALMDMHTLQPGQDFERLPESYVIFITEEDVLEGGLPIYHICRRVEELGQNFEDASYIVYVNGRNREDTEMGRLMHDLHCKKADEMYSETLAGQVRELKDTREGVEKMCGEMEKLYQEGVAAGETRGEARGEARGIQIGKEQEKRDTALRFFHQGLPLEQVAQGVKESVSKIQAWIAEEAEVNA